jgi:hypothetical protein
MMIDGRSLLLGATGNACCVAAVVLLAVVKAPIGGPETVGNPTIAPCT